MKLTKFDYNLPKEMIATEPARPRDAARLFVYNRLNKKCVQSIFGDIGKVFRKGDVLVLNNTKVIPARLVGKLKHPPSLSFPPRIKYGVKLQRESQPPSLSFPRKRESQRLGRKFKILLLEKKNKNSWTALVDGKGRQSGLIIVFEKNFQAEIVKRIGNAPKSPKATGAPAKGLGGIWEIKFCKSGRVLDNLIAKFGQMPLPPYIKQGGYKKQNKDWYQTIFAKYSGSVAAPTAGLHFTKKLIAKLKKQGIKIEYITLHVGLGTFLPVKTEKIEQHKMHKELAIISSAVAKRLNAAKKSGKKIVACGTTAARTLESFALLRHCEAEGRSNLAENEIATLPAVARNDGYFIKSGKKHTDIFIYPPYEFKFVDALITNFHLPKSTLMMLVAAFLSEGDVKGAKILEELYQEAINKKYRFYSYGDAMLVI